MTTIFPAWSHLDRESMLALRDAVSRSSYPVQMCDEIAPLTEWMAIAEKSIRDSDCVILILTVNSANSRNCKWEVSYAREAKKPTLIWVPAQAPNLPAWASHATWLNSAPIDASEAIARTIRLMALPSPDR